MTYYDALQKCAVRYIDMQEQYVDCYENNVPEALALWNFTYEFYTGCKRRFPLMKLNRWLGYIQGCLIERGYTTVEAERDWTRPLFRTLDYGK